MYKRGIMQLFSANATIFFAQEKKLLRNTQSNLVSTWAAQTAQSEEFMLQNVAYRPTVYRTGGPTGFEQMHRQRSLRTDHWLHFTQIIPVFKHRFRRYVLSAIYYVVQAVVNTRLLAPAQSFKWAQK